MENELWAELCKSKAEMEEQYNNLKENNVKITDTIKNKIIKSCEIFVNENSTIGIHNLKQHIKRHDIEKCQVLGFIVTRYPHSSTSSIQSIYDNYVEMSQTGFKYVIPATTLRFDIYCILPTYSNTIENFKNNNINTARVLLGVEIAGEPHPDWVQEYKKLFIKIVKEILENEGDKNLEGF